MKLGTKEIPALRLGAAAVLKAYLGGSQVWPLGFDLAALFAQGEQGVWYDPSDFSTMFQDAAGTTPVTAVEQPVGLMLDKSGRGNHAYQTTATSRPVLRQDGNGKHYLYFDGVDDWLVTPTITPGTDKVQVFAGVRKLSDATQYQVLLESSPTYSTNNGAFILSTSWNASQYATGSRGTFHLNCTTSPLSAPRTNVATMVSSIADDTLLLRIDGTQAASNTADQGTGNYLAYPLYIGRRGGTTIPFNGHLYSLIVRFGANLPIATIEQTEAWINSNTGAY